ncbi:MAG: glycosyltransferase family 2 protein [Scytonematopsis contorta HA4267-MV1]|jgi:cellulose synthase/poly-beta-1,6-N-acetylglucosamine synthase-like glycosyltransferase|nr:glycosyltransferase family 2 protein [Scytonematopsis contorta HA4267-MV1]
MLITHSVLFFTDIFLLLSASFILVVCLFFLIECIAALFPKTSSNSINNWHNSKITILVPAHNEELVIAATLEQLKGVLKKQDRLLVVADNCSDRTAEIARVMGASVIERCDSINKGKGYALDYGLEFLKNNPPDVVVIIDADCTVHPGTIERLTECVISTGRPAQAIYLMLKSKNSKSAKDFVSEFSNIVRNLVRPLGLDNLGINCPLLGTGMAFPWSAIRSVNLANGHLLEDLKLGLDLTIAGHKPVFCRGAKVTAYLPSSLQAAKSQKTRWVHGQLNLMQTYIPILLKEALFKKRLELLGSVLDLCIPPFSLLVVIWFTVMTSCLLFALLGASWIPTVISFVAGFGFFIACSIAWNKFARQDLPLSKLVAIPIYILWKIPVYFQFLVKPEKVWIRTERDEKT